MTKKFPNFLVLMIVAVLIMGSFAHSQALAKYNYLSEKTNEYTHKASGLGDTASPSEEEITAITAIKNDSKSFRPRIVFMAVDTVPVDPEDATNLIQSGWACLSLIGDNPNSLAETEFPIVLPVGAKVTGVWFTGWDGYNDSELQVAVERYSWDGLNRQVIEYGSSGEEFADVESVFNKYFEVNHILEEGWAYTINLSFRARPRGYHLRNSLCQITVDYELSSSPFNMASPSIPTRP